MTLFVEFRSEFVVLVEGCVSLGFHAAAAARRAGGRPGGLQLDSNIKICSCRNYCVYTFAGINHGFQAEAFFRIREDDECRVV